MLFDIALDRARPPRLRMGGDATRAFWTVAAGVGELRSETCRAPGAGERLVRTLASGISRGTEAIVFAGRVPPSQYAAMRAPLMGGAFPFPVKYGYSAVGLTDEGERVFVLHPHQDRFIALPKCASRCRTRCRRRARCWPPTWKPRSTSSGTQHRWPASGCWWSAPAWSGCSPRRCWRACRRRGSRWSTRCRPARRSPAASAAPSPPPAEAPAEQELIVHASGTEAGLRLALGCAAPEARIVEASWFADQYPAFRSARRSMHAGCA